MRTSAFSCVCLAGLWAFSAAAQIKVVTMETRRCFGGRTHTLAVTLRNDSAQVVELPVKLQLHQTSTATSVLIEETPWKTIRLLPRQTVLETAPVNLPAVKSETRFVIRWMEGTNKVFGMTQVMVYPTNLLAELKGMAGEKPLGVFEPGNQLKPMLKALEVAFEDLEEMEVDAFSGKLAVIGPFKSKDEMKSGFSERVAKLARKGTAVVWIQPPLAKKSTRLIPSFHTVRENEGAVVVVQPEMVSQLAESPQSQLNLIEFCRMALRPEPMRLPEFPEP